MRVRPSWSRAVHKQPQHNGGVIHDDLPQAGGAQGDRRDAAGVDRVGPTSLTGDEQPRRADDFAGISTTVSPSAISRWATCRPMPLPPSTAQRR